MNLQKCKNGHFYDADTNPSCPHCVGGSEADDVTVAMSRTPEESDVTVPASVAFPSITDTVASTTDIATVAHYEKEGVLAHKADLSPVVGWLVCIQGPHLGRDFRLTEGRNFIGRSKNMNVPLTKDDSVSRDKHGILAYDPKSNGFIVQPGDAHELFYLNGNPVYTMEKIKAGDKLLLGETTLLFIPCCSEEFNWGMTNTKEEDK